MGYSVEYNLKVGDLIKIDIVKSVKDKYFSLLYINKYFEWDKPCFRITEVVGDMLNFIRVEFTDKDGKVHKDTFSRDDLNFFIKANEKIKIKLDQLVD